MKYVFTFLFLLPFGLMAQNSVGIGTLTPNSKAVLELVSSPANTQGLLLPRVTTLPTGYAAADAGMMLYHANKIKIWNGTVWETYQNAPAPPTYWDLAGQITSPTNGAKDVLVNAGWLATNNRLYVGVGVGGGSQGPGNTFFGGSEINLSVANGNKINFLDGFNKRISANPNHFTFDNQENAGTGGITISSFLLNSTPASRFRVGTAAKPHMLTLLTNTGRVGIGTGSPQENLVIKDTANVLSDANISLVGGTEGYSQLWLGNATNAYMGGVSYYNNDNKLSFFTNGTAKMHLSSSGNLGIGISSPTQRLEVAGNIIIPAANDYLYSGPKTYYKSLAPLAFVYSGYASGNHNLNTIGDVLHLDGAGASDFGYSSAWLDLPDEAVITSIMISYVDNSNNSNHNVDIKLYRTLLTNGVTQLLGTVTTAGDADLASIRTKSTLAMANATVNNQLYFYTIGLVLGNTSLVKFHGLRIGYIVNKAN